MTNESELNLLGTAIDSIKDSTSPDDQHVANLLRAALRIRGTDITYSLSRVGTESVTGKVEAPVEAIRPVQFYPQIPLADELERQRIELTNRVAVPLGIDRNKFLATLPTRFPERLSGYDNLHLTVPLISPDLTSWGFNWLQVVEATLFYNPNNPAENLTPYIWSDLRKVANEGSLKVWKDSRRGVSAFPAAPHAVWIQDGTRYVNRKPKDVRKELQKAERAGDHSKGLGLSLLRPDMIQIMYWDLIGGQVSSDSVPCVRWDVDRPEFNYSFDDNASPRFRALVCGSEYSVA